MISVAKKESTSLQYAEIPQTHIIGNKVYEVEGDGFVTFYSSERGFDHGTLINPIRLVKT